MKTWLCITNGEGVVLAVYGSALGDMAEATLSELRARFPGTEIDRVAVRAARRPKVGIRLGSN
jgi:hypothetical protein